MSTGYSIDGADRPHGLLWAKWGAGGEQRYPLVAHLIDTAAAARALHDVWLPPRLAARLGELAGGTAFGQLLVAAAALHDLGKANPVFQGQLLARDRDGLDEHVRMLSEAGLSGWDRLPRSLSEDEARFIRRHEVVSASLLEDGRLEQAGARGIAAVVAGHHGQWQIHDGFGGSAPRRFHRWLAGDEGWAAVHRRLVDIVGDAVGVELLAQPSAPSFPSVVPALTALVCLADWLASDAAERGRFEVRSDGESWAGFYERRYREFVEQIPYLLGTPCAPQVGFHDAFGIRPGGERPVQRELLSGRGPGLTVVAVPTGEGKTEAALAHWLASATERQGLYFALPTMATADAMFERVRAFFAAAESPTLASLLHSRALLNSFYQPAVRRLGGEIYGEEGPRPTEVGTDGGGLVPADWTEGRHRALFSPVAVGTVDQLLSAGLRHRFGFMRLLGAATKTLVLDEVHSYDPFASMLVERLLAWAGHWHVDVVLLSATLPAARLNRYVAAYTGRRDVDLAPVYPGVVRAEVGGQLRTVEVGSSGRERALELDYRRGGEPLEVHVETVRALRQRLPDAKIGVVVNTVGRCQQLAARLADLAPQVLHARFPAVLRARRTSEVIARYGATSGAGSDLLIATQLVEQSIDLDLDVLVTDLAPAAALIQRAGRVWRHELHGRERRRPAGLEAPSLVVVIPEPLPEDLFAFLPYSAAEIHRTWAALDAGTRTLLRVPDDVQQLVDAADVSFEQLGEALAEAHLVATESRRLAAADQAVPTPGQLCEAPAAQLERLTRGELDEQYFQTRWVDERDTATLLLCGDAEGAWGGPLPAHPDTDQVRELLGCTVPVAGRLAHLAHEEAAGQRRHPGWQHRLLHDLVVVDLDATDQLDLDPLLGLRQTGAPHG